MGAILVIEDNLVQGKEMTMVLTAELRSAGLYHRIVWALNKKEALYHMEHQAFDLISIDGSFPSSYESEPSQYFALKILEHLGRINYKGRIIFYSEFYDDVKVATGKVVSGKPVHAYSKVSTMRRPLSVDSSEASISQWAEICAALISVG